MKAYLKLSFVLAASVVDTSHGKHGVHGKKGVRGTAIEIEERIVGGSGTSFSAHPFFVDLDGCGASLIWEDVALTAAHCNVGLSTAKVGPNQQSVQISSGTVHPNYNSGTNNFDVMVLKLASSVAGASTIGLETSSSSPGDGDSLTVIGLGLTSEDGSASNGLREVAVKYIPIATCNTMYGGGITDAMLCAGVPGGGKDSCQGDSGGPIFQGNKQVGIVSFGDGCARPNAPGVYARVSSAADWIKEQICCHSAKPPSDCGTVDPSQCPNNLGSGGGGDDDSFGGFDDDFSGFDDDFSFNDDGGNDGGNDDGQGDDGGFDDDFGNDGGQGDDGGFDDDFNDQDDQGGDDQGGGDDQWDDDWNGGDDNWDDDWNGGDDNWGDDWGW